MNVSLKDRVAVLSDGTGDTAEIFVRAILAQFNLTDPKIKTFPRIKTTRELEEILNSLDAPYLATYTFASEELRKKAWSVMREKDLTGIDLLYPAVEVFSSFLNETPTQAGGSLHTIQATNYFRRIEAIEFTVKHDDGMRINEIDQSDLILVGVSRSSKTPTSIYLAHKGFRVSNVPLVQGIEPPKALFDAKKKGVPIICLMIRANDLERIRKVRFQSLGATPTRGDQYIDMDQIEQELQLAKRFARQHGFPVIDVTDKAIEESASEILQKLKMS